MKDILHDISKKIDKQTLSLLTTINGKADSMGINYFIIGAMARDILLHYEFGIPIERKTNDIDFSIKVKSWPDKVNSQMNLMGFEESFNNSEQVIINHDPKTIIRFASLDGLVVLKLLAWKEKYPSRRKDAQDIYYIISKFISAGNLERLYNENSDLAELTSATFDEKLLGARLIGRDISKWIGKDTRIKIIEILNIELSGNTASKLVLDLMRDVAVREDYENEYTYYNSLINQLLNGLND